MATAAYGGGFHAPGERTPSEAPRREPARERGAVVVAAMVTALVVAGAIWRAAPVEALGAAAPNGGAGATLRLPAAYTLLSPLCELYDALTLLTVGQHGALLAWLLAGYAGARVAAHRRAGARRPLRDSAALGLTIAVTAAVYVAGALAPRPMAALRLTDGDELALDVHSHTDASHDGRIGFDAEANRRWHADAGFAAAYVTDHRRYWGAAAGEAGNPRRAADGTMLFPGIESAVGASRVLLLGARQSMHLDQDGRADLARLARDTSVVVVLTTPDPLSAVPATLPLEAVESSDGAPRGLLFTRRLAPEIERFAASHDLARVAGSDNHGWGRTATAWTVLRVPGWRAMPATVLDSAIRATIRRDGGAVRVVARGSTPLPRSGMALAATPALMLWSVATRLSLAERWSWLAWSWCLALLWMVAAGRRDRGAARELPNGGASSAGRARRSPERARRAALRGR